MDEVAVDIPPVPREVEQEVAARGGLSLRQARFAMQAVLSCGMIGFSMARIFTLPEGEDRSVYFSIMSGILGFWLPSPKVSKKKRGA